MAAPINNQNRTQHGLRAETKVTMQRHGLTLARLPAGCQFIHRKASELRTALEREVISQRGEITVPELAVIASVATWTIHGLLCSRWLQKAGETLNHSERLGYSREVARAATERERAIARLNLDRKSHDPWRDVLSAPVPASEPSSGNGCSGKCNATSDEVELRENASQC